MATTMRRYVLLLMSCFKFSNAALQTEQNNLASYLFHNYSKAFSPVMNSRDTLEVILGLNLKQIVEVNEKRQTLTTSTTIRMQWRDIHLTWDPYEFDNITRIRPPLAYVWFPDIELINSGVEGGKFRDQLKDDQPLVLYPNGRILFTPHVMLTSMCRMHLAWFPFDRQHCSITFGSSSYSGDLLNLTYLDFRVNTVTENGEWEIIGTEVKRDVKYYKEPYIQIIFAVSIKRKSFYYFFSLIVPCALMGFLALLGFTLPPDSNEKLPLGVTILFSVVIFLNMISTTMPANSDAVPLLGTYFSCIMVMIALSVVSTIVVNIRKRSLKSEDQRFSGIWRTTLLKILPTLLRLKSVQGSKVESVGKDKRGMREVALDDVGQEWVFAAIVVDKCCFYLSLIISLVSVAVMCAQSI